MKSLLDFFKSRQPATDATGRTRPAAEAEVAKPKVASGPLFLRRRLRFSVGVDFGTTSTKAAYLVMGEAGRRTRPIFFDHGLREYPDFCEPSVGLIHKGRLLWGAVAARALADKPWATGLRRLKVLLAGEHDPSFRDDKLLTYHQLYIEACGLEPAQYSIEALTAAVFATQLANLRAILEDLHPGQVEDAMYNVCVPIEQVENSLVLASYHRVIDVAQRLLRADGSLAVPPGDLLAAANEKLPTARSIEWSEGRVFAVPEAVAQVAAYLVSLAAVPGVHAVVDVGAGTTDVSIFNIMPMRRTQHRFYWYAARNIPRGTASIEREIASRLGAETRSAPTDAEVIDAVRNLHSSNTLDGIVQKHVDGLWKEARRTWVAAYNHLRVQHEFQGRPVFLAGGGSRLPHVAVTFARPWVPNFKRQTTRDLPVPRDFEVPAGRQAPFYRLSVAHGLAIPKPELGEYVLPKDAPDQTPVRTFAAPIEALGDQQPG